MKGRVEGEKMEERNPVGLRGGHVCLDRKGGFLTPDPGPLFVCVCVCVRVSPLRTGSF